MIFEMIYYILRYVFVTFLNGVVCIFPFLKLNNNTKKLRLKNIRNSSLGCIQFDGVEVSHKDTSCFVN